MQTFEYVMSAVGMAKVFPPGMLNLSEDVKKLYHANISKMTQGAQKRAKESCPGTNGEISVLFNAFTEVAHGKNIDEMNKFGCKNLYADSGGLQIVTAGKTITTELKQKVFETQCIADYGFCFDSIPLRSVSLVRSKLERANVSNKIFDQHRLEESARQTGKDFAGQLYIYSKRNAKTKGILIVQGNTARDMVDWFGYAIQEVPDSLKSYIAGIAVADTCMGNGTLETIEMMSAVRMIADLHGEQYTQHVHLLGVGAISRFRPTIFLARSGYLDCVKRFSYDSSTHTLTTIYGKWFVDGKAGVSPAVKCKDSIDHFNTVYEYYEDEYKNFVNQEEFINIVFGGADNKWSPTSHYKNLDSYTDEKKAVVLMIMYSYCLYQMECFVRSVESEYTRNVPVGDVISALLEVTKQDDMDHWMDHHAIFVPSNRIRRNENITTLSELFN